MKYFRSLLTIFLLLNFSGCIVFEPFLTQKLSEKNIDVNVTSIVIKKSSRRMYLFENQRLIKSYRIGLGSSPKGDKKIEGDGKTPEGLYYIDRKNPKSRYYLSLGISYPNTSDIAEAEALGKSPGGDIFIHGQDKKPHFLKPDWTEGCISLKNGEINEIYQIVRVGTPILIHP